MYEFIKNTLLKADSHVHANGMATNQDVLRLAHKYGVDLCRALPHINPDGSRNWANDGFSDSHEAYDETVSLIRTPEDLGGVVSSALVKQGQHGCIYTRLLSSGLNNCRNQDPIIVFENNMLAMVGATIRARDATRIETRISISIKRHLADGAAKAHELLDACENFQKKHPDLSRYITSLDMAGNESKGKPQDFFDVYDRAHKPVSQGGLGLKNSLHTGEVTGPDDIDAALDLPGVDHISHALSAVQCPSTLERICEEGIFVDQLLISNIMLHSADPKAHPIHTFIDMGIPVGLGSDDPGLQNSTIADEYAVAARDFGFTISQLLEITTDSVRHAFIEPEIKRRLYEKILGFAKEHKVKLLLPLNEPSFMHGSSLALG